MIKSSKQLLSIILCVYVLSCLVACNGKESILCCLQYPTNSDLMSYCMNHARSVGAFIINEETSEEQKKRLSAFMEFYESVKTCESVNCIEDQIRNTSTLPNFLEEFVSEHKQSEDEFQFSEDLKVKLILCGFRHAIESYKKILGMENE